MPSMLQQVQKVISEELSYLDPARLTPEKRLKDDLGADSLDEVELVMAFEKEFNIDIPDVDAERLKTVQDYVTYLEQRAPRAA